MPAKARLEFFGLLALSSHCLETSQELQTSQEIVLEVFEREEWLARLGCVLSVAKVRPMYPHPFQGVVSCLSSWEGGGKVGVGESVRVRKTEATL